MYVVELWEFGMKCFTIDRNIDFTIDRNIDFSSINLYLYFTADCVSMENTRYEAFPASSSRPVHLKNTTAYDTMCLSAKWSTFLL